MIGDADTGRQNELALGEVEKCQSGQDSQDQGCREAQFVPVMAGDKGPGHETGGAVGFQKWDGTKWNLTKEWLKPMRDIVRPLIEADAAAYAKENNITPRDCN